NGTGLRPELEFARREFLERAIILQEDEQAVTLRPRLPAEAHLSHLGSAYLFALLIDTSRSVGTADTESGLADCRKDRIAVTVLEVARTLAGVLEQFDRFRTVGRIVIGECLRAEH